MPNFSILDRQHWIDGITHEGPVILIEESTELLDPFFPEGNASLGGDIEYKLAVNPVKLQEFLLRQFLSLRSRFVLPVFPCTRRKIRRTL